MKILLLTVDFPPAVGGIQNLLAKLADGLATHHDVRVVAPVHAAAPSWDVSQRYGIARARSSGWWPITMLTLGWAGLVEAAHQRPDVVVCGHALLGVACRVIAAAFGVPYVAMAYAYEIRAPRMRRLAGWTLRGAALVVTVSEFSRNAVRLHDVPAERIVIIHPGPGDSEMSAPVETGLSLPSNARVLLSVARLNELYKGHDMIIRALPLILAREPDAHFVIVGNGRLQSYLQRLAAAIGVTRAVTFAGELPRAALDACYRRSELFILTSRESPADGGAEGYGLAFIEANSRGTPVVGGRSGGVPDAVIDGVTGLLVDPLDVVEISDAVCCLLADRELAARLGEQGRQRALSELSWSRYVATFDAVLAAVTTPPAKRVAA